MPVYEKKVATCLRVRDVNLTTLLGLASVRHGMQEQLGRGRYFSLYTPEAGTCTFMIPNFRRASLLQIGFVSVPAHR